MTNETDQFSSCPEHAPPPTAHSAPEAEPGDRFGRPDERVDEDLINRVMAVTIAECGPCRNHALDKITTDPLTLASFVDRALFAVVEKFRGVPDELANPAHPTSTYSVPFRQAVRAAVYGGPAEMFAALDRFPSVERRQAATDALHIIVLYCLADVVPDMVKRGIAGLG
jgi:hypothetical protein